GGAALDGGTGRNDAALAADRAGRGNRCAAGGAAAGRDQIRGPPGVDTALKKPTAKRVVELADRAGVSFGNFRRYRSGDWGARGGSETGAVASAAGKRACTALQNSPGQACGESLSPSEFWSTCRFARTLATSTTS